MSLFEELTDVTEPIHLAKTLANDVQDSYFDLGCLLYHIKNDDIYKTYDGKKYYSDKHKLWKRFCEDHISVSYRTAQYWLNIYRYFTDMGISKERLKQVGWSKAKELIDLTDDTNILEAAIKIAEDPHKTIRDLEAFCDTIERSETKIGEDTRETLKATAFNFKFYEAAAETVEQIVNQTAQGTGGDRNQALFKIVIEWYQSQNEVILDETVSIDDYVTEDEEEKLLA